MNQSPRHFAVSVLCLATLLAACGGSEVAGPSDTEPPPPSVVTSSLPGGTVGTVYHASLVGAGGTPPRTWDVSSGALPSGLSLTPASGEITGVPDSPGRSDFTIRVSDADGRSGERAFAIEIVPAPVAPTIGTTALGDAALGSAYSATLSATGGTPPYHWSIPAGLLPAGISVAPSTGVISGVPQEPGTFDFTVRVTGADGGSSTRVLSLRVGTVPPPVPPVAPAADGVLGEAYSVTLQAAGGGDGTYEWSIESGTLPPGLGMSGGTITGVPGGSGYFSIVFRIESAGAATLWPTRFRVYEDSVYRDHLWRLPEQIEGWIQGLERDRPRNPHLDAEFAAKLTMLRDPSLEADILNERLYSSAEHVALDGRDVPVSIAFPRDSMRIDAMRDLGRLSETVSILESFLGVAWPRDFIREFYGFSIGNSGGGGALFMEDAGTYAERALPRDAILAHELAHTYIGHERLTQFLEVYGLNVLETGSTDLADWPFLRGDYTPFDPQNGGVFAVMDIYQLIGHDAMGRAYAALFEIKPPFGQPLSEVGQQILVDQAPTDLRAQVAELAARIG